jgi:hypothetical protein
MKVLFTLLASLFCINAMAQLPATASSNLAVWLKADAGVTVNGSNEVTTWADQSGNVRNAVNSGVTLPTLLPGAINGKPALRFTNDRLETPLIDFTTTNAVEVFMVYKTVDNTLSLPLEFSDNINASSTGFYISDYEAGCPGCISGVNAALNGDVGYNYNAAPQPSTCFKIVNAAMDKNLTTEEVKIWLNNVLQPKAVSTGNSDNTNNFGNHKLFIGRRNCVSCLPPTGEFYLAEVVIYNRVLTTTEKNAVYTYLNGRYNVNNTVNVAGVCQQPALWLKADAGVTTSGTSVTQWADQSGNGNNVTQATTAAQPQLQTNVFAGNPSVYFDGTDWLDNTVSNVVTAGEGRTVFVVAKTTCTPAMVPLDIRRTTLASSYLMQDFNGISYVYGDGANSSNNAYIAYASQNTLKTKPCLLTYQNSALGKMVFRFDGTNIAVTHPGNVPAESGTTGFTVGRRNAATNQITSGWISEIIVYNSQLNATDIAAVENYLATKYGTNFIPPFAISSNKPVTVTSTLSGTLAANINDDNICTTWASTSAASQSASINLQAPTSVSSVYLNVGSSITFTNAVIETSPDNTTWTTATTFSGTYISYNNIFLTFPSVANVQYVRVRIPTSSGSFPRFNEFVVNPNFVNNYLKGITPMILNAGGNPFGSTVTNGQTLYASKAATYQWQRNGIDIPGAVNQSYTVTNYGNFSVTVTYDYCSGACNTALTSSTIANVLVHTSTPICNILFDGTVAASVRVPSNALINPTAAFTYEAWFKANANVGINRAIISKGITTNYASSILLEASTGKIVGEFYTGASLKTLKSLTGYNDNAWHHVAYTYDGANIKLYIDGTLEGTLAATGAVSTVTQDFTIGKYSNSNAYNFWGSIDEVRVWNTARTQTQINSTLYTQLVGNETNLQAYYSFNDGTYNGLGQSVLNKCTTTGAVLNGFTEGNDNYPQFTCPNTTLPAAVPPSCNIILNGTSKVDVGNTGTLTPTGTISFWMRPTAFTNYPNPVCLGSGNTAIRFELNGNAFHTLVGSSIGVYTYTNILTVNSNELYHVALTWDVAANRIKVYVNGKLYQVIPVTTWPAGNLTLTVGQGFDATRYFFGNLDDVALFNTEKTFTEIQSMYLGTAINPADASLRALYNFNNNTVNGTSVVVPNQAAAGGLNGTTAGTCGFPKFTCVLASSIAFSKPTSTSLGNAFPPSNGNDGDACTQWNAGTSTGFWILDLETPTTINNILLIKRLDPGAIWGAGSRIDASADGINWTLITNMPSGANQTFENFIYEPPIPITGMRYIRYIANHSSSWVAISEFLVNQNLINESVKDMTPVLLNADGSFKQGQATIGEVLYSNKAATYQWKRNGVNIVGATNQSYTVPSIGNYSVAVTYTCTSNCNGALSTPTVPSGLSANAIPTCGLVQNGTAAGITIPHNTLINPTAAFTYEAFFKAGTDVTVARKILSKGAVANYSVALGLQQTSGKIQGEFVIGGTLRNVSSINAYNDNQWHHVACTYDGAIINLYVDGQLDNALAATGAVAANTSDMEIGRNTDGGGTQPFIGNIDEVRIWNVARTPAQILAALGTVLVGNESGLQAYYHFNNVLFNGQNRVVTNNCSTTGIPLNGITFGTATTPTFSCTTPAFTEPDCNINLSVAGNNVSAPHNAVLALTQFTVAAYVKTNQATATTKRIVYKEGAGGENYSLNITSTGKAEIQFNGSNFAFSTTSVNDNLWHYIAGTYDGATLKIYVDGTLSASLATVNVPSTSVSNNLFIGQNGAGSEQYFGRLDQVSIWNIALTQAQIQSNIGYNLTGAEANLIAHYNFNDNIVNGTGQTVINKCTATGVALNGTTNGAATTPSFTCTIVPVVGTPCGIQLHGIGNGVFSSTNTAINTSNNFTVEFIVKAEQPISSSNPVVTNTGRLTKGNRVMLASPDVYAFNNFSGLNLMVGTNGVEVWEQNGYYNHGGIMSSIQPLIGWHHVAISCTNGALRLFVDGRFVSNAGVSGVSGSFYRILPLLGQYFPGTIAEARFWNRALPGDEINNNVNTTYVGNEVGLQSLYRFNNNTLNGGNRTVTGIGPLGSTDNLVTIGDTRSPIFTCANYTPNTTNEAVARPGSGNNLNLYAGKASLNNWGVMPNTGTITFWFKTSSLTPIAQGILTTAGLKGNEGGNKGIRFELLQNGNIDVIFGDNNSTTDATTTRYSINTGGELIQPNRWYHVALAWNKTSNIIATYLNGILSNSNAPVTQWPTNFLDVYAGVGFSDGNPLRNSNIDEVCMYNTPLTQIEVRDRLVRKINPTDQLYANLVHYYRFDEVPNYVVYDYKGTTHGTIYGSCEIGLSSAPIGDVSAHQYFGVGSGASVAFGTTARDTITAQVTAGTNVQGIQVYGVNEIPNTQAGQFVLANNNRYAGVFVIGDTNQVSYNAKYSYNLNPYFLGSYVHDKLLLYKREHNAITGWAVDLSSTIDSVNKKYFATGKNSEFMLGYSPYPVRPRLGNDTTLYVVCDNDTYNLLPVYIPATDGYSTAWNAPNPSAAPLGNWRLIATSYFGFKDTAFATVAQDIRVWTGAVSNDWHNVANWNIAKLPTAITHVVIPVSTPNPCLISTADAFAASMQVKAADNFNIAAPYNLMISGKCVVLPVWP